MIQKLQNFFHTDKWWGKTLFVVLIYVLYWCIFYGSWFLIPDKLFLEHESNSYQVLQIFVLLLIFIFIPAISFFIPSIIRKTFKINKIFLYILHVILIILSIALFLIFMIFAALHNLQIG